MMSDACLDEKVISLEEAKALVADSLDAKIATNKTRIDNLEKWQEKQNGSLQRLEEKMDKIHAWLIGLMGGMCVSLILLAINLILAKGVV